MPDRAKGSCVGAKHVQSYEACFSLEMAVLDYDTVAAAYDPRYALRDYAGTRETTIGRCTGSTHLRCSRWAEGPANGLNN